MSILKHELYLPHMATNCLARSSPEGIQGCARDNALEDLVAHLSFAQIAAPNVLTLTMRTLEWDAEMVPWARLAIPNLVLNLGELGAVEVPGQRDLKRVQRVSMETGCTPSSSTWLEVPAGCAIICAGNP